MVLQFMNEQMTALGIPYEFGEWTSEDKTLYFVGELPSPESITTEDGMEDQAFFLNGWHTGDKYSLEVIKNKIKKHFHPSYGFRASTEEGTIVCFYEGAFFIETGVGGVNRIQINLRIKQWKGDF